MLVLEIKTFTKSCDSKTPSVGTIFAYLAKLSLILIRFPSCCSKSKIEPYFQITDQKGRARDISCSILGITPWMYMKQSEKQYSITIPNKQNIYLYFPGTRDCHNPYIY